MNEILLERINKYKTVNNHGKFFFLTMYAFRFKNS